MNKGGIIGLGVGIPIVLIVLVFALNIYALSSLQYRGTGAEDFDLLDMSMDVDFQFCNPTFFPASFNTMEVDLLYKSTHLGTFVVWGKIIPPGTATPVDGRLNVNGEAMFQLVLAALGSAFGGTGMDIDPSEARYEATLDAPIFGIIPFSISETYSPDEFMSIVQGQSQNWSC